MVEFILTSVVSHKLHLGLIHTISSKKGLLKNLINRSPLAIVKNAITVDCNLIVIGVEMRRKELLLVRMDHSFKSDSEEIRESKRMPLGQRFSTVAGTLVCLKNIFLIVDIITGFPHSSPFHATRIFKMCNI